MPFLYKSSRSGPGLPEPPQNKTRGNQERRGPRGNQDLQQEHGLGIMQGANPSPPPAARAWEILCHPSREQHHFPFTAEVSFVTPMGNNKQDSSTSFVSLLCACRAQSLISIARGKGDGTHLES